MAILYYVDFSTADGFQKMSNSLKELSRIIPLTVEGLAYACLDYPEMVEDMVETCCQLVEHFLDQVLALVVRFHRMTNMHKQTLRQQCTCALFAKQIFLSS